MNNQLKPPSDAYECECPHLHRGLPFRAEFQQAIINDILEKFPSSKFSHLVYVSQGPGGFLSDIKLITELIQKNYEKIDLIFIEPLYETNADILYACLAVKKWCKQQSSNKLKIITPFFYKTLAEYAHACTKNETPKGHIFITIDPDDKKTMPNFSNLLFRKKFTRMFNNIMHSTSNFYYLYFQNNEEYTYRHMIIGVHTIFDQKPLIKLQHSYGEKTLYEHTHHYLFLDSKPVYPCNLEKQIIQIGRKMMVNDKLASLL